MSEGARPERPLFRRILKEARSKERPEEWLQELRKSMESAHIDEKQLLSILEIAAEGMKTDTEELPRYKFNIVTDKDFRTIFTPTYKLDNDAPFIVRRYLNSVGLCSDVGPRFKSALGAYTGEREYANREGRGIVFFCEGKPLAFMKLVGLRSVMAFETVQNPKGETLLARGIIYAPPYSLTEALERIDISKIPEGEWVGVSMEDLKKAGFEVSFTPALLIDDPVVVESLAQHSAEFNERPPHQLHLSKEDYDALKHREWIDASERL